VELAEHLQPQLPAGGDALAQAVATRAPAVEEPVAEYERETGRDVGARCGRRRRRRRQCPQDLIGRQGGLERDHKVSTQEQGGMRLGTGDDEHSGGRGVVGGEELEARVRLEVAGVPRWADTVGEALQREEVGRVGPARDVHDPVLELRKQIQPPCLVVVQVPLLL
jgi:hypothetical protein